MRYGVIITYMEYIIDDKQLLNTIFDNGETILSTAIKNENYKCALILLKEGAYPGDRSLTYTIKYILEKVKDIYVYYKENSFEQFDLLIQILNKLCKLKVIMSMGDLFNMIQIITYGNLFFLVQEMIEYYVKQKRKEQEDYNYVNLIDKISELSKKIERSLYFGEDNKEFIDYHKQLKEQLFRMTITTGHLKHLNKLSMYSMDIVKFIVIKYIKNNH